MNGKKAKETRKFATKAWDAMNGFQKERFGTYRSFYKRLKKNYVRNSVNYLPKALYLTLAPGRP